MAKIVDFSLKDKVALVTGGSRGIGRAIAIAFAQNGAKVVISARKLPELEAVAAEIKAEGGVCVPYASHIAKFEESKAMLENIKKQFGRIDILVNNAGTNPYNGPLIDTEEWAWDVTNSVNIKGPFLLSLLVAKAMREQGGGNIINMASVAGIRPSDLHIYGITKAALIMMTRVMAKEFGQYHIRVNAIAPGVIESRFSEFLWKSPEASKHALSRNALPMLGKPEDVAGAALYLASEASRYVTGSVIVVDGGEK